MNRRNFLTRCAPLLVPPLCTSSKLMADDFPARPIKIIVAGSAGSVLDVSARRVGELMARQIGQSVIIENRPGGNSIIAVDALLKSKADGHTILVVGSSTICVLPYAMDKPPFDPVKDLIPLTLGARGTPILMVPNALPVKSLSEFIDYAKARPGQLALGSPGVLSPQHMAGKLLERTTGVRLNYVVYKNQPEIMTDLIGGRLHVSIDFASMAGPQLQAGKMRGLAVFGMARKPAFPDIPTTAEAGYPDLTLAAWHGYFAPGGTPAAVSEKLSRALASAIRMPEYADFVASTGGDLGGTTQKEFKSFIDAEQQRWRPMVQEMGIRVEM